MLPDRADEAIRPYNLRFPGQIVSGPAGLHQTDSEVLSQLAAGKSKVILSDSTRGQHLCVRRAGISLS